MKRTITYLNFDGNCRQAMTFYGQCFGTQPGMTPFSAVPSEMGEAAKAAPDRILHSEIGSGGLSLMACDVPPGTPFVRGTNFAVCLECDTQAEMERIFAALSENGKVTMPLAIAFWGGWFGMLTDQFGIDWMLSFRESPPPAGAV